jgi:hypothetical protein
VWRRSPLWIGGPDCEGKERNDWLFQEF